jgi:hypothetical protein
MWPSFDSHISARPFIMTYLVCVAKSFESPWCVPREVTASIISGCVVARDGKLKYDNSFSDKMQMAVVADYYKDFMILPMPFRFVIKIVAAMGRIRGKKGYLPEYFDE